MSADGCEVVITESGVPAMRDLTTGEVMHPGVGPRVESVSLYVAPSRLAERLAERGSAPLRVLDVGLGAGSNAASALRVAMAAPAQGRGIQLVSFDHTLAPLTLALQDENAAAFGFEADLVDAATALRDRGAYEADRVRWQLRLGDLLDVLAKEPVQSADVVFWDPYSPRANPTLWSVSTFTLLRRLCAEGATVHTYSAATTTRTALLLAGFFVGLGPRSGRKHKPTTIAATSRAALAQPLDGEWLRQLARARVPLPLDAPEEALTRLAEHPQFA